MSRQKLTPAAKRAATRRRKAAKRRETPFGRLFEDGATQSQQVRRRLQWLAQEWNIPAEDVARAMRFTVDETGRFKDKYPHVNLDWLLAGDLKGLQLMMAQRRTRAEATTPERLKEKLARLSEPEREAVSKMVDQLMEGT